MTPEQLEARLTERARLVEAAVERRLASMSPTVPARLLAAMRHAMLGGGKRVRPFLVIEAAAMLGVEAGAAVPAAVAVECIHGYSLVHDDLPAMDDDDVRRGRPTVHIAFGEATAILAGDALQALAFEILGAPEAHADAGRRSELILGLARAAGAGGMCGGQQLDLEAESVSAGPLKSLDGVMRIQAQKTGALITVSAEAGAILAGASASDRAALTAYGRALGAAFQIADDLLDVEGEAGVVGKATGKDAKAGKATFVSLLGIAGARARLADEEREAAAALARFGSRADVLIALARFLSQRRS